MSKRRQRKLPKILGRQIGKTRLQSVRLAVVMIDYYQRLLEAAERRKDWPAVLVWDQRIDRVLHDGAE